MAIYTEEGAPSLGPRDFQLTHQGVTVGLHFRVVENTAGRTTSIAVVEKVGAAWQVKGQLDMNFDNRLEQKGVVEWLRSELLPKLNAWLAQRFGSAAGTTPPPSVPDWVPEQLVELDAAIQGLAVTVVDGVPRVSLGGQP